MKKTLSIVILLLLLWFLLVDKDPEQGKVITGLYPWQVDILPNGKSRVFGVILNETSLQEVTRILKSTPELALYDSEKQTVVEAYYKSILLGGLIGSFIFTLDVPTEQLDKIKISAVKKKRLKDNEFKYELDKVTSEQMKIFKVKNLVYLPTVQLDEATIIKRFGQPEDKVKLKNNEAGWHYLYPEKGLDLIFNEEGKEMLQYVSPRDFNLLLEPLLSRQNLKH